MPRVSRFVTEFTVEGRIWEAAFTHRHGHEACPHLRPNGTQLHVKQVCSHYDTKGRPAHLDLVHCPKVSLRNSCPSPKVEGFDYRVDSGKDVGKSITIQHLTICKLRHKGSSAWLTGHAPCSMSDTYNWRRGLHLSLQRALEKAKYCALSKVDGKLVVADKKPIYDDITTAFWREMRIPPAQPVTTGLIDGELAAEHLSPELHGGPARFMPVPPNRTPLPNQHGLGYAGAD